MRVIILTPEYVNFGGGIASFYRSLVPALVRKGAKVRVFQGSPFVHTSGSSATCDGAIELFTLETRRYLSCLKAFDRYSAAPLLQAHLAAAWAMWEQTDFGKDCDIIEATDWGLSFIPPVIDGRVPCIAQMHGSIGQIDFYDPVVGQAVDGTLARLIERSAATYCCKVQTHSAANASFWSHETGRPVEVIRPAWRPSAAIGQNDGSISDRAVVIGRIQRWKGPHVLCDALERMGRPLFIDWFGRDTVFEKFGEMTGEYLNRRYPKIWGQRLIPHGEISPREVAARQASALINIVPSSWDVFNFTAVEAMSSGRPLICSSGAGASELIEHGANGFVFAAEDSASLANTIETVLSLSPSRLKEIGQAAREAVQVALAPDRVADQRIASYQQAINSYATKPVSIPGWVRATCLPGCQSVDEFSFLDHFPLRQIVHYATRRTGKKLLRQ